MTVPAGVEKESPGELGISGSALSQYIHEQNWPSFLKLLAIADFFDVSLDYLVYGQPGSSALPDYGPLYRYIRPRAGRRAGSRQPAHRRGGAHRASAGGPDRDVAKELAATPAAAREGLIQDDELLRLERYCAQCDLASLHLDFNVIRAPGGPAPGRFLSVVAANLEKELPIVSCCRKEGTGAR